MRTVREVVQAFFDAFNRHDVDALVALYAKDAVNHQMPTAPLRGRDVIRKSFEEGFAAPHALVEQQHPTPPRLSRCSPSWGT